MLRPVSTVGQVPQAHVERRTRPTPGNVFDDVAYARLRDGRSGWPMADATRLGAARPLADAWGVFGHACATEDYVDVHCWCFVPSSFRLIVSALHAGGVSKLALLRLEVVDGEFHAVLGESADPALDDLGVLAVAAQEEERLGSLVT